MKRISLFVAAAAPRARRRPCGGRGGDSGHAGRRHARRHGQARLHFRPRPGTTRVAGNGGNDLVFGRRGNDSLSGDEGNDFLFGGPGDDDLDGGDGNDVIHTGYGADMVDAGDGNDMRPGRRGRRRDRHHRLRPGKDRALDQARRCRGELRARQVARRTRPEARARAEGHARRRHDDRQDGRDIILALAGNDTLNGLGGPDFLFGMAGNDTVNGTTAADRLWGGPGDDTLNGGDGPRLDPRRLGHRHGQRRRRARPRLGRCQRPAIDTVDCGARGRRRRSSARATWP